MVKTPHGENYEINGVLRTFWDIFKMGIKQMMNRIPAKIMSEFGIVNLSAIQPTKGERRNIRAPCKKVLKELRVDLL